MSCVMDFSGGKVLSDGTVWQNRQQGKERGACRIMEWGVTFLFVRGVRLWFCLDGNWKLLECNVVFTIFLLLAVVGQGQLGL